MRVKSGRPRVFGVQFLKATPGVVYDSLGINGAHITVLSRWSASGLGASSCVIISRTWW